ncbi:MAG: hypothetical protein LBQ55_04950, partial [Treponema sp.]|nr:hypothetical protein [Treponema sp.]
ALNEARRLADGGAEIVTVSNTVDNARLFGPAGLEQPGAVTAAQNLSTSEIELSWNAVTGAAGYYIIRRQYALDNSDPVPAGLTLLYYVNAADMHLKGKDILLDGFGIKTDSDAVSAEIAYANGTYTLKDQAIPDVYYTEKKNLFGLYADEQNDMLWGYPYRYHVVPVLSENDKPIMDSSCSLGGVSYSAASMAALEKTGRALGFVFDVTATKGTYSSGGDSVNDGIGISWTRPDYLPAGTKYQVFRRREASSNDWDPITTSPITAAEYEDKYGDSGGPVDGTVYEYVVGVSLNGSNSRPDQNARFINQSRTVADEDFPAERKMSGFVLPRPTMISASRTVNLDPVSGKYYEIVKWNSVGVDSLSSDLKNRGVSGYEIQVRDQSGERAWQALQTVLLETDDDKNRLEFTANLFNDTGLLTVLRDYRHYFRVRAFVSHGGRVYSRAPENPSATLDGTENDYVKWGVKQISAQEFAALTSLTIGSALQAVGTLGSSSSASQTVTLNHTPFFQTAGGSLTVNVSISGTLARYVSNINSYAAASLNFTGNVTSEDGAPLYSGTVKISGLTSTGGTYEVTYNGSTVSVNTALARKPFTFGGNWSYVLFGNNNGQFQDCSGLYNWNETTGWQ